LAVSGSGDSNYDHDWAARVLGVDSDMPEFADKTIGSLARKHSGLRPWSAGSLYEGFVSAIVGQSISVAVAAITEQRLNAMFNAGVTICDRTFWPSPRPDQLADARPGLIRECGVTHKRAEALVAIGLAFAGGGVREQGVFDQDARDAAEKLMAISGIGPWTVSSALLWGLGDPDAHPTGDVALLRAARMHYPQITDMKSLDRQSEAWRPWRGWAARLLWLDLLGFEEAG
jgi:3-methyladenine DNA glycosylase/8-oxoguanine DNA glycosylase